MKSSFGIISAAYALGDTKRSLADLSNQNLISDAEMLNTTGFQFCHQQLEGSYYQMLRSAVQSALAKVEISVADITTILFATALNSGHYLDAAPSSDRKSLFAYPIPKLQRELGLLSAKQIAISQQGCVGAAAFYDIAGSFFASNPEENIVLCIAADMLPPKTNREILFNLVSDAASAWVLQRDSQKNRYVAHASISQPFYWDGDAASHQLLAAYFPLAKKVVEQALARADLSMQDISAVIPHNVSRKSWELLAGILDYPKEQIFMSNISRVGHAISSDNTINLVDAEATGFLQPGKYYLVFNFGFGATWMAAIFQH